MVRRKQRLKTVFFFVVLAVLIAVSTYFYDQIDFTKPLSVQPLPAGKATIVAFDVGQGECFLIHTAQQENILIDAGNPQDGRRIVSRLKGWGIKQLDYLFLTHPHSDHIGGADYIIEHMEVKNICMPKVAHTSQSYREVLEASAKKGMKIEPAKPKTYLLASSSIQVLAPVKETYEDLNACSIVLKWVYEDFAMLFTGDLPMEEESELFAFDLSADILKVAHHGSKYSTSEDLLASGGYKYAILSLGKDNSYHYPHPSLISRLEKYGLEIWRTDMQGDIMITTDGKEIHITSEL